MNLLSFAVGLFVGPLIILAIIFKMNDKERVRMVIKELFVHNRKEDKE
jgi:hypothetical protein